MCPRSAPPVHGGSGHSRQEAAWAASLCHRLRQTPGGSFPLTKKAALLGSLPQTREALQLVRRLRAPGEPDNSTEELLYAPRGGGGTRAVFHSDYLHCDLRLSIQRYFVPNVDRILESVVSTRRTGEFAVGVIGVFNLRGGGRITILYFALLCFVFLIV